MGSKKRVTLFVLILLGIIFCLPASAKADIGPKPSVDIEFKGFEGEVYYTTILAQERSTGPTSAYEEGDEVPAGLSRDAFLKMAEYEDPDGFYFHGVLSESTESHSFRWGYYPPETFKILAYFPEADRFVSSEIMERYAFDSYYRFDGSAVDLSAPQSRTEGQVMRSYAYSREILTLAIRIVLTIALELLIALLFRFKGRRVWSFIIAVNIITQIALNLGLNFIQFQSGMWAFVFFYVVLEILVFIIEAVLYAWQLPKRSPVPLSRKRAVIYALAANIVSLAAGLALSSFLPRIF